MKKTIYYAFALVLMASAAHAQNVVAPCVTIPANGQISKSCNPIMSTNPMPVTGTISATTTPAKASGAYSAATITNSSTQALAASATRGFLDIKNESSTATIACRLGGTAALNTAGSLTIPPNWHYSWDGNFVPSDAVNCISSAASSPATIGAN